MPVSVVEAPEGRGRGHCEVWKERVGVYCHAQESLSNCSSPCHIVWFWSLTVIFQFFFKIFWMRSSLEETQKKMYLCFEIIYGKTTAQAKLGQALRASVSLPIKWGCWQWCLRSGIRTGVCISALDCYGVCLSWRLGMLFEDMWVNIPSLNNWFKELDLEDRIK